MNENGIPIPLIRDNHLDKGTLPGTMFVISFVVALVTLIGKITNLLGNVDYNNVLWLLGMTGSFWVTEALGRKVSIDTVNKKVDLGDGIALQTTQATSMLPPPPVTATTTTTTTSATTVSEGQPQ